MIAAQFPEVLGPAGKILLVGSGCVSIGMALHKDEPLDETFARLAVGALALTFFADLASHLASLGDSLTQLFEKLGNKNEIQEMILEGMRRAVDEGQRRKDDPAAASAVLLQVWRTGVWGVMSKAAEWCFLLSKGLLEVGRDVSWQVILLVHPVICGLFPLFPRIFQNLIFYAVCVVLWGPIFTLITIVASAISKKYLFEQGASGLGIIALELLGIIMTFTVPAITQRLVSGALSGSMAEISVMKVVKTVTGVVR